MPVVDSHHHLWDLERFRHGWLDELPPINRSFLPDDLAPLLHANGVDATVLVQCVNDSAETRWLLEVAAATVEISGVVGWVDLERPDVAGQLASIRTPELVGIRHLVHDEDDPDWLRRPAVRQGLRALAAEGLTFDLLVRPRELPAAFDAVRAVPELPFVVDHIAKPPIAAGETEPWGRLLRPLAELDNCACKLSGMVTEADHGTWTASGLAPYVERVLHWFGPERCMFGTDWPVCLLAGSYPIVVEALHDALPGMSASERDAVWGGTASRFYGLSVS